MAKKQGNQFGVRPRGKRFVARPYIAGVGHKWGGTHDTEAEAIEAAQEVIAKHETRPARQETIASFAARWIRDFPRPKKSTNDRYHAAAQRFAAEVDPHDRVRLHEFETPAALTYSRKHPVKESVYLGTMYGDARRSGLVNANPFSELGLAKGRGRKDIIALTAEELETLVAIAHDEHGADFGPVFAAIVEWAAYTTMRPSEIFGLDRADLNLQASQVQIQRQFYERRIELPKNGRTRVLPYIPPQAVQALQRMPRKVPAPICEQTKGEILFPGKLGQRISQGALWTYWNPVRSVFEASLEPARRNELRGARNPKKPQMDFYELRHFGATALAELGVEDWVGAEMMGHTDGGKLFRDTYSHPSGKVAAQRLRAAFGQNVKPIRAVEGEAGEAANG